jgi:hypothetical protein
VGEAAVVGVMVVTLAAIFLLFLLFSLITAVQAKRRGYPLIAWLLAGALGNPVFLLVLLGVMPDFRRKKLRITEMDDLERRLAAKPRQIEPAVVPEAELASAPPGAVRRAIDRSLGDQPTQMPERSPGDEPTRDLPLRSLGDEETRM